MLAALSVVALFAGAAPAWAGDHHHHNHWHSNRETAVHRNHSNWGYCNRPYGYYRPATRVITPVFPIVVISH